jgi:hypothetical protein
MKKIQIKVNETIELTKEGSKKFFELCPDSLELIEKGYRGILHCLDNETIQSAIIEPDFNIANIDYWDENEYEYCKDILQIKTLYLTHKNGIIEENSYFPVLNILEEEEFENYELEQNETFTQIWEIDDLYEYDNIGVNTEEDLNKIKKYFE